MNVARPSTSSLFARRQEINDERKQEQNKQGRNRKIASAPLGNASMWDSSFQESSLLIARRSRTERCKIKSGLCSDDHVLSVLATTPRDAVYTEAASGVCVVPPDNQVRRQALEFQTTLFAKSPRFRFLTLRVSRVKYSGPRVNVRPPYKSAACPSTHPAFLGTKLRAGVDAIGTSGKWCCAV